MRHMVIVVPAQRLISSASCGGTLDAAIFVWFPMCTLEPSTCGSYCAFLLWNESERASERDTPLWRLHERGGNRICVRQKHSGYSFSSRTVRRNKIETKGRDTGAKVKPWIERRQGTKNRQERSERGGREGGGAAEQSNAAREETVGRKGQQERTERNDERGQ